MIKILTAFGAMLLLSLSLVMLWRMRGMLNWKRSLRREFKDFKAAAGRAAGARQEAMAVVAEACDRVWRTTTPEWSRLMDLRGYLRSIAACFSPQSDEPELCITVGRLLMVLREVADRLERILGRPGSGRLQRVRIRHVRQTLEWYGRLNQKWLVRKIYRYREAIRRVYQVYLIVLPDPFSWLAYFSNRLTILQLTRYLALDAYLFVGRLAVDAYDSGGEPAFDFPPQELERALEALDDLEPLETFQTDPRVREIRSRLVGFGPFMLSAPGIKDWQAAVMEAAELIAGRHFPNVERALEEAALGPLLRRCQAWIRMVTEIEALPVLKHLFRVRLDTLNSMKSLGDIVLTERFREALRKGWQAYRWTRWPLRIYRWMKKVSPLRVTTAAGVFIVRKGVVNFLLRYTFDSACRELEILYRQSLEAPAEDHAPGQKNAVVF